jgi:ABC-type protease/lipase transport system fused ATPase/permease subunit
MRTSRPYLAQIRRALGAAWLFSGFMTLLFLALPLYVAQVVDIAGLAVDAQSLPWLTAMTVAALVTFLSVRHSRDLILGRAALWLGHTLNRALLSDVTTGSTERSADRRAISDLNLALENGALARLGDAISALPLLALLFLIHPTLGWIGATGGIAALLIVLRHYRTSLNIGRSRSAAAEKSDAWWRHATGSPQTLAALGLSHGLLGKWEKLDRSQVGGSYALQRNERRLAIVVRGVLGLVTLALVAAGVRLSYHGEVATSAVAAASLIGAFVNLQFGMLVAVTPTISAARLGWMRLSLEITSRTATTAQQPSLSRALISLHDASVVYPNRQRAALSHVSLDIQPGDVLAIAGPAGSGKSTLTALLAGAVSPVEGHVQRAQMAVGFMTEQTHVLPGSVRENIVRFDAEAGHLAEKAAMRANVHDILSHLDNGYDTIIDGTATGLSGRELNAVALARAIYGAPHLVILDRPETGLDADEIPRLAHTLAQWRAEGVGLVIATNEPRLQALASATAHLDRGRIRSITPNTALSNMSLHAARSTAPPRMAMAH